MSRMKALMLDVLCWVALAVAMYMWMPVLGAISGVIGLLVITHALSIYNGHSNVLDAIGSCFRSEPTEVHNHYDCSGCCNGDGRDEHYEDDVSEEEMEARERDETMAEEMVEMLAAERLRKVQAQRLAETHMWMAEAKRTAEEIEARRVAEETTPAPTEDPAA